MMKNETKTYYYAWVEEEEKWVYSMNGFKIEDFPYGYVDYEVQIKDGIIIYDSYSKDRIGKSFNEYYDESLWNK